jgi:hypothetical protein
MSETIYMSMYNLSEQMAITHLVNKGFFATTHADFAKSAAAMSLERNSFEVSEIGSSKLRTVSLFKNYVIRIPRVRLQQLYESVKNRDSQAYLDVACLYALGLALPQSEDLAAYWNYLHYSICGCGPARSVLKMLRKHCQHCFDTRSGIYLYRASLYAQNELLHSFNTPVTLTDFSSLSQYTKKATDFVLIPSISGVNATLVYRRGGTHYTLYNAVCALNTTGAPIEELINLSLLPKELCVDSIRNSAKIVNILDLPEFLAVTGRLFVPKARIGKVRKCSADLGSTKEVLTHYLANFDPEETNCKRLASCVMLHPNGAFALTSEGKKALVPRYRMLDMLRASGFPILDGEHFSSKRLIWREALTEDQLDAHLAKLSNKIAQLKITGLDIYCGTAVSLISYRPSRKKASN